MPINAMAELDEILAKTPSTDELLAKGQEVYDLAVEVGLETFIPRGDVEDNLALEPGEADQQLVEDFAYVPGLYEAFTRPYPNGFRAVADSIYTTVQYDGPLNSPNIDQASNIINYLDDWEAEAIKTYRDNYLAKVDGISRNTRTVIDSLTHGICGIAMFYAQIRIDAMGVAASTIKALELLRDENKTDWEATLKIGVAIAGIAAAVPTDGVTLMGSVSLLSSVISGSMVAKDNASPIGLVGDNVYLIIAGMVSTLNELSNKREEGEAAIKHVIEQDIATITGSGRPAVVVEDLDLPEKTDRDNPLKIQPD